MGSMFSTHRACDFREARLEHLTAPALGPLRGSPARPPARPLPHSPAAQRLFFAASLQGSFRHREAEMLGLLREADPVPGLTQKPTVPATDE